jgi:rubrerythrin
MGWDGQTLADFPKMDVIKMDQPLADMMMIAMNLEKAAQRFYETILKNYGDASYADTIKTLSLAEEAHAKTIYTYWQQTQKEAQSFESLYSGLDGEIMEGGENLTDVIEHVSALPTQTCRTLMEFALTIEIQAYDLYRNLANELSDATAQTAFLSISQMEKKHMQLLAKVFTECSN